MVGPKATSSLGFRDAAAKRVLAGRSEALSKAAKKRIRAAKDPARAEHTGHASGKPCHQQGARHHPRRESDQQIQSVTTHGRQT